MKLPDAERILCLMTNRFIIDQFALTLDPPKAAFGVNL
jgi:hypothetical protein